MQILIAFLAASVAASASQGHRIGRSDPVLVRAVLDGDTVVVVGLGSVRLLGIDAPEIGRAPETPAPFAREARERLAALVLNRWIRLESDGHGRDAYNRHLAYVLTEDGQFINATLVRDGLARVSAREPLTRLVDLQRAEREAQASRRGMWGSAPSLASTPSAPLNGLRVRKPSAQGKPAHPARKVPDGADPADRRSHRQ